MATPLQMLVLSSTLRDVEPILRRYRYEVRTTRVETEPQLLAGLSTDLDVILADCDSPGLRPARALELLREQALEIPVILTADSITGELAVDLMKQGAVDFLPKSRLEMLGLAVNRALAERARRRFDRDALKESKDFARNIVDSSLDMIIAVDLDRTIVEFNRAAEETFGYRRDEVLGKKIDLLYADPPSGLIVSQTTIQQGRLVREVYNRRKNGEAFPSYLAASILTDAHGNQIGLMGISRDISEIKRTEHEVQRRTSEFSALYETTRDLSTEYNLPVLLSTIVERATQLLGARGGGIYLYDPRAGDLQFQAGRGEHNPAPGTRLHLGEGIAGRVAESRKPVAVDAADPQAAAAPRAETADVAASVLVPMLHGGELIGVLTVGNFENRDRPLNRDDLRLLELFASHAASALHNATLFQQVRSSRMRLQKLSGSLLRAQENERRTIARELHDEIGQALTGIQLSFQAVESLPRAPEFDRMLNDNTRTVERLLQQVRDLSLNLRPSILDDFGLVPALRWLIERQPRGQGITFNLEAADVVPRLAADLETVCFRVAQEALTNILRHAKASNVRVELQAGDAQVTLTIRDDGIGFDVPAAMQASAKGVSLGLLGMSERVELVGGRFGITSAVGRGTTVEAVVPKRPEDRAGQPASYVERRAHPRSEV